MQIDTIPGANVMLGAPEGKEGEVDCLPVIRGANGYTSQWKPTPEEVAAIFSGAPILLYVMGAVHPPVAVTVGPIPELEKK